MVMQKWYLFLDNLSLRLDPFPHTKPSTFTAVAYRAQRHSGDDTSTIVLSNADLRGACAFSKTAAIMQVMAGGSVESSRNVRVNEWQPVHPCMRERSSPVQATSLGPYNIAADLLCHVYTSVTRRTRCC